MVGVAVREGVRVIVGGTVIVGVRVEVGPGAVAVSVAVGPGGVGVGVAVGVPGCVGVMVGPGTVGVRVEVRVAVGPMGVGVRVGEGTPGMVGVAVRTGPDDVSVGVGVAPPGDPFGAPWTKMGSAVRLSSTAAYVKSGAFAVTTIAAFSVARLGRPAASKIPEICTPEWAGTVRTSEGASCVPDPSKIVKDADASVSPGLNAPALVRKPALGPFRES